MNREHPWRKLSFVIPVMNEDETLRALYEGITTVVDGLGLTLQLIFIDDGSTDNSFTIMQELHEADPRVTVLQFRKNFGKSAALAAGFAEVTGDVVFTMDADLQDDPQEIPRFLQLLQQDYDVVSGWKKVRHDPPGKVLPSRLFNFVTARLTGIPLHDFSCGFKAYRREALEQVSVYGEMHRYIPALAGWLGFRVGELVVQHHPRRFGRSKFGLERYTRGLLDLLTVIFTTRYARRPLHLFGGLGLLSGCAGTLALAGLLLSCLVGQTINCGHPLWLVSGLLLLLGVQLISVGLVCDVLIKLENRFSQHYSIRRRLGTTDS